MGYYIQTEQNKGKAQQIVDEHGARIVSKAEAQAAINDPTIAVIVIKDNGYFEAAGFCFNEKEFNDFAHSPTDNRPTQWLLMDRTLAIQLTKYPGQ